LPGAGPSTTPTATIDQKAVFDVLDGRIAELRRELETLVAVRTMLQELETALRATETERNRWTAEEGRLRAELDETKKKELHLDDKAKELATQVANLHKELEEVRAKAESQRADLLHQIEANSRGRIEEFKTSLGLTLSKLVQDLPGQHKELSQAAAKVLLLQFHQFLEMLEEKGIRVRPAKGTGA
jgi:chromosome segregation ATPase